MRKLGLVLVVVALVVLMGNLSSDMSVVNAQQSTQAHALSAALQSSYVMSTSEPRAPLAEVSLLTGVIPVHEPTSLFLMGGSLLSAGIVLRRRLRR